MLHAPASRAKQGRESGSGNRPPQNTAQLSPRVGEWIAARAPAVASGAVSVPAGLSTSLAARHRSFGNQAVLRTLRAPSTPLNSAGLLQRKCACGGSEGSECAECAEKKEKETQGQPLQRLAAAAGPEQVPPIVHETLRRPGRPLDGETRAHMENALTGAMAEGQRLTPTGPGGSSSGLRMGRPGDSHEVEADRAASAAMRTRAQGASGGAGGSTVNLDGVRVHTDSQAAESALSVGALAYTVGRDVVFASGQYSPGSSAGRRLLAHELSHVVQQSGGAHAGPSAAAPKARGGTVSRAPIVQRQIQVSCGIDPFKIARVLGGDKSAALDVLNCCEQGLGPLPKGCTKDLVDAARKLLKKTPASPVKCPLGFHPGRTPEHKGDCCNEDTESAQACCPPERIASSPTQPGKCCKEGEVPQKDGTCGPPPFQPPEPPPLVCPPPGVQTLKGKCCLPPEVPNILTGDCELPPPGQPAPPPQPAAAPPGPVVVNFNFDRPRSGEGASALDASLTGPGRASLKGLIGQLTANPSWKVQLVGHASPEGTDQYNLSLGERRARIIAAALAKASIDASRIANAPGGGTPTGCQPLDQGMSTCGELGATSEADRNVTATLFAPAAPAPAAPAPAPAPTQP